MPKKQQAPAPEPEQAENIAVEESDSPLDQFKDLNLDEGPAFNPADVAKAPEGFLEAPDTPDPEKHKPKDTPRVTKAQQPDPELEPEVQPEGEDEGEEDDGEPRYTEAQMRRILELNQFDPNSVQQAQPEQQPEQEPERPVQHPQISNQLGFPAYMPQIPEGEDLYEMFPEREQFQNFIGEVVRSTAATVYMQMQQEQGQQFGEFYESRRAIEKFVEAHPGLDKHPDLLNKAIMKARAENPEIKTREGILEKVEEMLDFLPALRRDVETAVRGGKKIDVLPKRANRAGVPNARGKMASPDAREPQRPQTPLDEFREFAAGM